METTLNDQVVTDNQGVDKRRVGVRLAEYLENEVRAPGVLPENLYRHFYPGEEVPQNVLEGGLGKLSPHMCVARVVLREKGKHVPDPRNTGGRYYVTDSIKEVAKLAMSSIKRVENGTTAAEGGKVFLEEAGTPDSLEYLLAMAARLQKNAQTQLIQSGEMMRNITTQIGIAGGFKKLLLPTETDEDDSLTPQF